MLLIGGEVDIRAVDKLDYDEEILKRMDIVIGSIHSNYLNTAKENTMRIISALKNRYVDAIAHPTGVVFGSRAPYTLDMDSIFEAAVKYNKAMEINSYLLRLDLSENLARKLKAMGGKFVINTDSHRLTNMDLIYLGVEVARRAGLTKEDIINTMSPDMLSSWQKGR
jgi:DNA polymerase (family 10)